LRYADHRAILSRVPAGAPDDARKIKEVRLAEGRRVPRASGREREREREALNSANSANCVIPKRVVDRLRGRTLGGARKDGERGGRGEGGARKKRRKKKDRPRAAKKGGRGGG
jgi:hypothetical protein